MSASSAAATAVVAAAAAVTVAASVAADRSALRIANSDKGGVKMSSITEKRHLHEIRIQYKVDAGTGELLTKVDTGGFWFNRQSVRKPIPEIIRERLPEGAEVMSVVIDCHHKLVRVYYTT